MKVIYVLGLGHSGTTILDLTLSRSADVLGLGELRKVLKQRHVLNRRGEGPEGPRCACGEYVSRCPFWSTIPDMPEHGTIYAGYRWFFEALKEVDPCGSVVDSSKNLPAFRALVDLEKERIIELYPVFMMRDVRGWIASARHTDRRNRRKPRSYAYYTLQWYKRSREIHRTLAGSGRPFLALSYEQFCFDVPGTVSTIRGFAGLPRAPEHGAAMNAHGLFGNRNRLVPDQNVVYDRRWFRETGACLWPLLFFPVLTWSMKHVYGARDR